ncbi:MAG: hypothetical protein LBF97_01295 [Elusimicrobiota bacterium]|nr:hypothetical protein [Elusimicrobiota bacterium]
MHVLKGWLIDIIWKGQFIDWLDKDDFKEIINMAGLTEQSVDKVINYLSDKPYKPRTFDMVFNRLVQINYIDNYYR